MKAHMCIVACILFIVFDPAVLACSTNHAPYWWCRGDYTLWHIEIHYNGTYTWNAQSEFKLFEWDEQLQEYVETEYYGWRDAMNAYTVWPGTMIDQDNESSWCKVKVDSIPIHHKTKWSSGVQSSGHPELTCIVHLINEWFFFYP